MPLGDAVSVSVVCVVYLGLANYRIQRYEDKTAEKFKSPPFCKLSNSSYDDPLAEVSRFPSLAGFT